MYGDGDGLYLQVTGDGQKRIGKSWIFRYRLKGHVSATGKPLAREMGLGSVETWSLAEARERARQQRQLIDQGTDPIEARKLQEQADALEEALCPSGYKRRRGDNSSAMRLCVRSQTKIFDVTLAITADYHELVGALRGADIREMDVPVVRQRTLRLYSLLEEGAKCAQAAPERTLSFSPRSIRVRPIRSCGWPLLPSRASRSKRRFWPPPSDRNEMKCRPYRRH